MAKLRNIVHLIGGRMLETWENSCTHLTVDKTVPVTAKITCALATLKPIVTIEYWEAISIAVREFKKLPKIKDFLPTIKEDLLSASPNLLLPDEKRRTLFKGLSFIHFCAKQYYAYVPVITAAGGKSCVYPTKRPLTPRDLTAKNAIVIQQSVSDSSEVTQVIPADYSVIHRKLQDIKRRMISETEIPLAILHCSTEMYCNPLFKFDSLLKSKPHVLATNVMVEDTQDVVKSDTRQVKGTIIPETYDSQDSQHLPKRVRFSNESEPRNVPRASTSGIATKGERNAVERNVECEIIPETCNFSNTESTSKKSSYESEQRNVPRVSKSGIAAEVVQRNKRDFECEIIAETCTSSNAESKKSQLSYESEQRNIVGVFSSKADKKSQVIPETCPSPNVNVINIFSSNFTRKNSNKRSLNIFDKNDVVNKPAEKERIVNPQEKNNSEKNNSTPSTNTQRAENLFREDAFNLQQRENILMNEDDNFIFENVNFPNSEENKSIIEKSTGNNNTDKCKNTSQERSNDSVSKRIITIEETDDGYIEQIKENNVPGKRVTHKDPKKLLKERQLGSASNSDKNNRTKENETEENKLKSRNAERNRHERYLNQEHMDKLLRKDAPNGKRFKKASVIIPKKRLQGNDFY